MAKKRRKKVSEVTDPKVLGLAVREFAVPSPRTGSIETHSGYGLDLDVAQEGQNVHLREQERRAAEEPRYQAEVRINRTFETQRYHFAVSGRMDGLVEADGDSPARIEEIKATMGDPELLRDRLAEDPFHPYCLQLRTYGYIHWLEQGKEPKLSFRLVSLRTGQALDHSIRLDREDYEGWLARRLEELALEAAARDALIEKRRRWSAEVLFPFESPRQGQLELIERIESHLQGSGSPLLIQAPTGLGKTVGVIYPLLKESLSRGQKVIYVTPKNSQHSVAEDAIRRIQENGTPVKALTVTAKAKLCFKAEPLCNPEYCEYARDHYTKVHANGLLGKLAKKKNLTARHFRDLGEEYEVCPYELQLDAAEPMETVICDYNYVFAPRVAFGRLDPPGYAECGKPNLVIDEAHHLPSRATEYYSPVLSCYALELMRERIRELPRTWSAEAERLLDECQEIVRAARPAESAGAARVEPDPEPFLQMDSELREFLGAYLAADVTIEPKDPVLRLCNAWSAFTEALDYEGDEFFTTWRPSSEGGILKITCCDASAMLQEHYDSFRQVVGFSATLKPFEYYGKLSGLEPLDYASAEFQSPFPRENRKILVIPQVSTRYQDRARSAPRIAEAISRIAALKPGNYFAFFPSFEYLETVAGFVRPPEGFHLWKQQREMRPAQVRELQEELAAPGSALLVFAVQGGVLSEGVDFPGEMAIGAFIVGPGLPHYDLERELLREYYERHYGSGFDYACVVPAMTKVIQAAGRVIRSETDRGLIVLMDGRFLSGTYAKAMPAEWFEGSPQELLSQSILKEVSDFWGRDPARA